MTPRLEVRQLGKSFGGIAALTDVSFSVTPGSVHALLGENGAGKSTLVKIVSGIQPSDSGSVLVDGAPVAFASPAEARRAGVVAVYQDPKLFPHLDVAENIWMGNYPRQAGLIQRQAMYQGARALFDRLGVNLDVHQLVMGLSIGEAQFVEFARAMAVGTMRLLFLDEPTAALSPGETRRLFDFVRRERDQGTSVIFISHRLEELRGLVDAVTILRDGRHVLTRPAHEISDAEIVRAMVGRDLGVKARRQVSRPPSRVRLAVQGLGAPGRFSDVSFELRAGEVVGMAGLVGAGRTDIALGIMGLLPGTRGRVEVDGVALARRTPKSMKRAGVAYVPEDRDAIGLVPAHSIRSNLTLAVLGEISRLGLLSARRETNRARDLIEQVQIKTGNPENPVSTLSGGNRQKVVIGKWMAVRPGVFLLDEPTHGIDVGTKAHIHHLVRELAESGAAVLVISSDLPEVLAVCDRILVIRGGRVAGTLVAEEAREDSVMALATGLETAA